MKVAVVTARFPYGAVESFIGAEVRALRDCGVEVVVVPTRRSGQPRRDCRDLTVAHAPRVAQVIGSVARTWVGRPGLIGHLLSDVARDPRHMMKNLLVLPWGLYLGERLRADRVDHVHAHWLSTSATIAWVASVSSGVPFSVTAHRWDIVDANLLGAKARDASFIRFISLSGLQMFEQFGLPSGRRVVVHMGVEVPTDAVEPATNVLPDADSCAGRLRVLCPANLVPVKGHRVLLDALALCGPEVTVDLAGDGPQREALLAQVDRLGIKDRVQLLGHVPHDRLLASLDRRRYDCVILPSLDLGGGEHEGIPVSLMEAMARGLPVISTRSGGVPELVSDDVDGLLVNSGDAHALASQLTRLASDFELRRRLGEAARITVRDRFDVRSGVSTLLREIRSGIDD